MASERSAGSDLYDSRRFRGLPLNESRVFYPRYYPDWQYDPYRLSLAEKDNSDGEKSFKPNIFPFAYDNVGFYAAPGSQMGIGYKEDSSSSADSSDSFRSGETRRRCIVVVCIASVVFLIGISVAIGLYFGVYDRPESLSIISSESTTTDKSSTTFYHSTPSTTSSTVTAVSYEASLKLDQVYDPALDDPYNPEYVSLKTELERVVNKNLQKSDLSSAFIVAVVTGFRQGSIEALLKLDFSSEEVVIANRVETLNKGLVATELQKVLREDKTEVDRLRILVDDTIVEELPGTGTADLGESCFSVLDCSDSNTQCSGSPRVCTCIDDYYDSNGAEKTGGVCNPKIPYHSQDVCTEARQCITLGAVCKMGVCVCDTTHFYKNDACHLKIEINSGGCEESAQCATPGAVCSSGTCSCPQSQFFNENQCTEKVAINGAGCSLNSHCATLGAVCSDNLCICNPSSHFLDGQNCLMKHFPGQSCSGADECMTGQCVDSICQCPSNTYSDGQVCQPKKPNGADCTADNECLVSYSVCDNISRKCSCTATMYPEGSVCRNKKGYGEQCSSAVECLVTGSSCDAGTCACPSTSFLQGTTCINKKANGESCSDATECLATNSICSSGTCQCPAFRYLDGINCLNKKQNGQDCSSDKECLVAGSICDDASRQCSCPSTMYLQGMTCIDKKANGESCSSSSECLVTDAVCSDRSCGCPATRYLEETSCIAKKLNGERCLSSMECLVTGAVCDGATGTCSCPSAMYLDGMSCQSKKAIGESCTSSVECLVAESVCNGGQCGCPANMYLQGMTCLNKKANGESCTSNMECLVTNSVCNGGRCGCPANMYLQGMTCFNKKANGESCSSTMECLVTDSVCNGGRCACPSAMYLQGMTCLTKKANGEACSSAAECLVTNSVCNGGQCGCPTNMFLQGMSCLNKKGHNEACIQDMECMSSEFVCRASKCQCVPGKTYNGMMCITATTTSTTELPSTTESSTTSLSSTTSTEKSTRRSTTEPQTSKPTKMSATTTSTQPLSETTSTISTTTTISPTTTSSLTTTEMTTEDLTTTTKPTTTTEPKSTTEPTRSTEPSTSTITTTTTVSTTGPISTTIARSTTPKPTTRKPTLRTFIPSRTTTETTSTTTGSTTSTIPTTSTTLTSTTVSTTEPGTETTTTKPTTRKPTLVTVDPSVTTTEISSTTTNVSTSIKTEISTTTNIPETTTSGTPGTTTAPDEVPTVVLNGTVTANRPYDPELADPTSDIFQNYSMDFKKAIEDGLRQEGQEGEITNITFREGSIVTDYILEMPLVIVIVPETRQDIEELPAKIEETVQPVVDRIIITAANDQKSSDFIKSFDVTNVTPVKVMPDPPCRNGLTMLDYAEKKVCGEILGYLVNNSMEDTCSTYLSLLDCVSLMYSYDGEVCSWNNMRANLEKKAMMALGLENKVPDNCVPGNYYEFTPLAPVKEDSVPCMDLNLMLYTAKYECHFLYDYMMTESSVTCSDVRLLESCVMTKLEAHYDTCTVNTTVPEYGLTMMVNHQAEFFPNQEAPLHTCEFCASPNIEEIMRTNCILPMYFTSVISYVGNECGHLHSMILCVEAQASLWINSNCSVTDIVNVIKSDQDRFHQLFAQVPAFQGDGFAQCLDQEIKTIGPELSGNLCNNHNYIAYVFMYECTDWVRLTSGQVFDICSEHLLAAQCVLSHLNDILGLQCSYDAIHKAIWERNYQTNILDMLELTGFPGTECEDHFSTRPGQCQLTLMSNLAVAYEGCVMFMEEDLERTLMAIPEMACGIYEEATRCALREAVVYTNPLCSLEDIEPAILTGVFQRYPDVQNCPSQGSGPYNREALCESPNSLGSTYLAFCGSVLTESISPDSELCSDLKSFGECTRVLGTHQDFILSLCHKSQLADAFQKLDRTLIRYFAVDPQCFDTHVGQCVAPVGGVTSEVCPDPTQGEMVCMLDNECGGLEKCCSSGCNMECTTNIEDTNPKNGTCPLVPDLVPCPADAEHVCYVDDHCDGGAKCCYDGCRHYCREPGGIYTAADCRHADTTKSAILSCSMELTLSYDSCRAFSELVNCVQSTMDMNSYNNVQCQYVNTQEDVSNQMRDLFGDFSYCRVYRAWFSVSENGCLDPNVTNLESDEGKNYTAHINPYLEMVIGGEEFEIIAIDFSGGDNCRPVMVQTYIYALTINEDLLLAVSGRIANYTTSGQLDKQMSLAIMIYEHPGFNKCTDPPSVINSISKCLPEFNDTMYKYDHWKTCKPVQDLATCTSQKMTSICDLQELKSMIVERRDTVLDEFRNYGEAVHLAKAVERYDLESCEDGGDVNPCWDEMRIESTIGMCGMDLDLSGFTVNGDVSDMYGVTPQMCRHIYDLMSCTAEEIRGLGAKCEFGSSYAVKLIYKFFRDNVPNGNKLPEESTMVMMYCEDYVPVCSSLYISQVYDTKCYVPYFHDPLTSSDQLPSDCSSTEAKDAFKELVMCLRLTALSKGENDCTASKIVNIIDKDYYKIDLFQQNTNITDCIGASASNLDAEVMDNSMVCQSREALQYFAQGCGQGDVCSVAIDDLPDDSELKCNTYFWLVSCVERAAANMSFSCEAATISGIDLTGTALEISPTTRQQCESQLTTEFSTCQYPLIRSKSQFEFCFEALHYVPEFELSAEESCNLYYESMYCVKTILTYSPEISCDPENLDSIVQDFILDFLQVETHTTAQMTCSAFPAISYTELFGQCSAVTCDEALANTGLLLQSATACGVNIFTIQRDVKKYTCRKAIETFTCFTNVLNEGRPQVYACKPTVLFDLLLSQAGDQVADVPFNVNTCWEWIVTVTYYSRYCNNGAVPSSFERSFTNSKLPVLMDGLDYEYRKSSCGSVKFEVTVWTDLVESELQERLNSIIYTDSNFTGDTVAISLTQRVFELSWCRDAEALKYYAVECVKAQEYQYIDWEVCRPVNHLGECIVEKIYVAGKYSCKKDDVIYTLFGNETDRTSFLSWAEKYLNLNKTIKNRDRLWLDVVRRYSQENCQAGETEVYPCDNPERKLRIYETCKTQVLMEISLNSSLPNYGLTPDNCRDFFSVVSCVTTELKEAIAPCSDLQQYVYERMVEEFDPDFILPDRYTEAQFCGDYEPVCSSQFILAAREFCPWAPDNPYRVLDCRYEADQTVAVNFLTCVRLLALSKNQEECTSNRIKEIIKTDYYRLNQTIKMADIDQCLPDETISSVLPTRESVCASGSVITMVEDFCSPDQLSGTPCSLVSSDILETGNLELGCMFYLSHWSCIQRSLANMTFTCSIEQLANTPVPQDSLLHIQRNDTDRCLAIYSATAYQSCEANLISDPEILVCTYLLSSLMPILMRKDQNTTCSLYHETLSCYQAQAKRKELTCSAEQLHNFQLGVMALSPYGMWLVPECYSPPEMFEVCPAKLPEGDLCTSTKRLTNLVIEICTTFISPEMSGNTILNCQLFQSLLWCGTNITVYAGSQCSEEQVKSALLENDDTISMFIPDFDVSVCSAEPVHWLVELLFLNETFSSSLADRTSLAFKRFVKMKYFELILSLFDQFGHYEIVDIKDREGKVVLIVSVPSKKNPSSLLYNTLATKFGADMQNITLGSVFEDSGDSHV